MKNGRCDGWQPNPVRRHVEAAAVQRGARDNETHKLPRAAERWRSLNWLSRRNRHIPARLDRLGWARFICVEKRSLADVGRSRMADHGHDAGECNVDH